MKFCFVTFLSLFLTRGTLQTCLVTNFITGIRIYGMPQRDKCIQCQNEVISSELTAKVKSLVDNWRAKRLEITDTNSPDVPAGVFNGLYYLQALCINNASVETIQPEAFTGLNFLSQLSLKSNKIEFVEEDWFANLTVLEDLDLSFNKIASIHNKTFDSLTQLRVLSLRNNFLTELPPDLFKGQNLRLQVLDLSFNKLTTIENKLVSGLKVLEVFYLNNNNLMSLDGVFDNMQRLKNIHIHNNKLQTLNNLTLPPTISLLNASHNLIMSMSFSNQVVIDFLDLATNGLVSAESLIFENGTIKQLILDNNYLGIHPLENSDFFRDLVAIESLSLANNNFHQLNRNAFIRNQDLTNLNLTGNSLSNSDFLRLLPKLEYLNLAFNNFDSSINLTVLTKLKEINLSFNNLTQISFNLLAAQKYLQTLNLSHNKIEKVGLGCFRNLGNALELDLSHNKISCLHVGVFSGLLYLRELDLSNNQLVQLKDGVFHSLTLLNILNLRNTTVRYTDVENIVAHSPSIIVVDLAENNWPCSDLIKFTRKYKSVRLVDTADYNTTNVNGVACNYGVEDVKDLVNLEAKNFTEFDTHFSTTNTLLIFIFIILLVQVVLKHIPLKLRTNKLKNLNQKHKNEQEMQLVDC